MGKQKGEGGRSQNRPSSSSFSASLVPPGASSIGFGGFLGSSRIESSSLSEASSSFVMVDNEVAQHLKRLGRKDPTTKVKALTALCSIFEQKSGEELVQIVPQWAYEYKRLLLDYNREVRRAAHDTMSSLVTVVRRGLAPHLKSLMGPWWFAQFDPIVDVSQAARRSLEAAFPTAEKRLDALALCINEIFLYLDENLKLTPQAMSDKATPLDELEDMHNCLISSSLLAISTMIDILLGKKLDSGNLNHEQKLAAKARMTVIESAEKLFSMHNYFLDFLKYKSPAVRSATCSVLTIYIKNIPHAYNEGNMKSLSTAILGAFQEKDISCHSSMWDMIILFSKRFPDAWSYNSIRKIVLNRLWQFLRSGCYGSQRISYPALVNLLGSLPTMIVNEEYFLLCFFQSFWAGRNPSQSSAIDNAIFFKAFKECVLWALVNATRYDQSKEETNPLSVDLVNDILVKLLWCDYFPMNPKHQDISLETADAVGEGMKLSDDVFAEPPIYTSSYYQELGKCIVDVLSHLSLKEVTLLRAFCSSFVKDCSARLQLPACSKICKELLKRIVNFFLLLDQLQLTKSQSWPWELLAGPLIANSFTVIKSLDCVDAVKLVSVLVEVFGPEAILSHIHVCNKEQCSRCSTSESDDDSSATQILQTFEDDFITWCLLKHTSSSGAKLDLLLSLVLDKYLSEQWCAIITHVTKHAKCSRTDSDNFNHADNLELFAMFFEKLRKKTHNMMMENVQQFGAVPEDWRNELLDSSAISIFCETPCFCISHAQLLRAILGGSVQDDKICFLSKKAVMYIFEKIFKMLVIYLTASSFEWTRHSISLLLSLASMDSTMIHKLFDVDNVEVFQFAFHVLEGSFFCLELLSENSAFISSILAAILIIDWECSLSSLADGNHSKGFHENEIHVLRDSQFDSDDYWVEQVDGKLAFRRRVHLFCNNLLTRFSSIVSLCNLSELRNILIQTIRFSVFETDILTSDQTTSLCSKWVTDVLKIACRDSDQFQCTLDQLLSEANCWPMWVAPLLQDGNITATLLEVRKSGEFEELRHDNFVALVVQLITNLGMSKVIAGCSSEVSIEDAPSLQCSYSRAWLAAELLCTWRWRGGNASDSVISFLSKYANDETCLVVHNITSSLANILFDGALIHAANNHWIAFCSWVCSNDCVENIEEPFLRALISLLHALLIKHNTWGTSETIEFFKHVIDKLFIDSHANRACLRILPFVLSFVTRPLGIEGGNIEGLTKDALRLPITMYNSIVSWLHIADSLPPASLKENEIEGYSFEFVEWVQVVMACYPVHLLGGVGAFRVEVLRGISNLEKKLLLSLFRKQSAAAISVADEMSAVSFLSISSLQVEMMISKLTAVATAYCWVDFDEEDWNFVLNKLHKWLESSVLLMEEMAEMVDDAVTNGSTDNKEAIIKKLEEVVLSFDPLVISVSATALITSLIFSELLHLQEAEHVQVLWCVKQGTWLQVRDHITENVLRMFFTTGVVEAIAKSFSDQASTIIASSRMDYFQFWDLIASSVINAPEHVRTRAFKSMELWGLTEGPVSSLYAILFSSKSLPSLKVAAFVLLSTKPICNLSIWKENFLEDNAMADQETHLLTAIDTSSEDSLRMREEIASLILKPAAELMEMEPTGHARIDVFVAWALLLACLHSLPSSSTSREKLVQFVQESVGSTILDCLFQHIPLKLVTSLKRKDVELSGEIMHAANAAKQAINAGSLLITIKSLWPIGPEQLASLAGSIYGMMIQLLPSYVRNWFTCLRDRSMSSAIEFFTKVWCSPYLLSDELSQVKETVIADEIFSVSVNKSIFEIVATYKKEETGMDLVIRLPSCYPLRPVDVECTRSLGISEIKQRKWLLSLTAFIRNQNGAIAEAIRIWKSNFDKEFEGVEECPICYSIIHTTNHSLPRLACKTCKHKFHSACLYKWFSTSHKSTCPLCQTPF
ncbi:E3 ubiquitin-protein ligase listerin [Apostasia shenzhenica]|uniref:E3 ubiquitin-protein ligase listerin n=1 Tax=Apostasia shenzhenica TaxID=1088818 RepID=A0A2I0BGH9_9ASPA|nr:E3 ubiquitin-protein ligase listerin [Apostasia shenzhenica]